MINSLANKCPQSRVYVLCMDTKCKEVIDDYYSIERVRTISLGVFEDKELLSVKEKRSPGEYCWTCTAKLIKYVICNYDEEICTYIDSDLFFYSDPSVLIDEMLSKGCSVQVISHRFPKTKKGRRLEIESGKNCVQFNTFTNNRSSLALLDQWIEQCIKECSVNTAGDQKYTSDWDKFSFVNISENGGAGMAPWNISRYRMVNSNTVYDKIDKKEYDKIFYHFQGVIHCDRYLVSIDPLFHYWIIDKKLVHVLYCDYLKKIEETKELLERKYKILPIVMTYISDSHSEYSFWERIIANIKQPIPILIEKVSYRLCMLLRRKNDVIDVRNL